jgi:hypothetical protein
MIILQTFGKVLGLYVPAPYPALEIFMEGIGADSLATLQRIAAPVGVKHSWLNVELATGTPVLASMFKTAGPGTGNQP